MATYLPPGSNVKGDAIQTLYLMNPSYGGYTDPPNPGNMVLIGPGPNPVGNVNPSHQQQSYSGYLLPANVPQQSHLANTSISHQNVSSEMFASCGNGHGYSWNGGNELMFIPSSDIREENQALATRLSSIAPPEQQPVSEIRNIGPETFQDRQVAFVSSEVSLSEGMQEAPSGAGQTLSLSLSPQPSMILNQLHRQPYPIQHSNAGLNNTVGFGDMMMMSTENNYVGKCERMYTNQWMMMEGAPNSALRILPNVLPSSSDFQEHPMSGGDDGGGGHGATGNNRHVNGIFPASSPRVDIYSSKYLKCAQELLNEVVSVGKDVKGNSSNASPKVQSWTVHTTFQDKDPAETGGKDGISSAAATWVTGKDIVPCVSNNTAGLGDQSAEHNAELTTAQKQEIQMKKSKLMTMLDEVEQRYRQYHHQMQMVVATFESVAGLGAARAYTALALQTISRHFRCLKDAIRGQVRAACKALGDREEGSRLRFIDRHLRQQRALQQLGMVPHHPWRPQRGLPERSVSVLRAWLFEHFLHPYPKDSDKVLLARQTGLTRNQVSNWFINARVRLWKPMVEEMYAEEMKEPTEGVEECNSKPNQGDGTGGGESARKSNSTILDGSVSNNNPNFSKSLLRPTLAAGLKDEAFSDAKKNVSKLGGEGEEEKEEGEAQGRASEVLMIMHQGSGNNMKPLESFLLHEKGQGTKKARNGGNRSTSPFLPSNLSSASTTASSTQCGDKAEEVHDPERPAKQSAEVENNSATATASGIAATPKRLDMEYEMSIIPIDGASLLHDDDKEQGLRGFGAFRSRGLNRYMSEGIANASYHGSSNSNGVSLTLGLQQHGGGHGHMDMVMRRPESDGLNAAPSFYGVHDVAAAANSNFPWQLPRARGFNPSR